jgi:hypothetical protein
VYADDPQAFYFYAGRPAAKIASGAEPCAVPAEQMRRDFMEKNAVAVIFGEKLFTPAPCWSEFSRTAPLTALFRDGSGIILGFRKKR